MLKWSFYNLEISKNSNGSVLIFNTLSSALGSLKKELVDTIYKKNIIDESCLTQELIQQIEKIKENGFLVDEHFDEVQHLQFLHLSNRFNRNNYSLVIAPTLDCNMRCNYCYEDKANENFYMTEETENNLVAFTQKYINDNRPTNFQVTWYGGEPLMAISTIERLSKTFITMSEINNINYKSSIITNGILLDDPRNIDVLVNSRINFIQVTIDGTEEYHNKRRYLKNGFENFSKIIKNIHKVMDSFRISIRVNVDGDNISNMDSLIDYFEKQCNFNENVDYYFAPVEKATDACKIDVKKCFNQKEFADVNHKLKKKMIYEYNYSPDRLMRPQTFTSNCGATHTSNFIVDPIGNLYNCWSIVGVKNFVVGNTLDGIVNNQLYEKWIMYNHQDKCKNCNLLPICNTGCPYKKIFQLSTECESPVYNYSKELKIIYDYFLNSDR